MKKNHDPLLADFLCSEFDGCSKRKVVNPVCWTAVSGEGEVNHKRKIDRSDEAEPKPR
jgi:hypothetical protein